jgi:hypothetical protein
LKVNRIKSILALRCSILLVGLCLAGGVAVSCGGKEPIPDPGTQEPPTKPKPDDGEYPADPDFGVPGDNVAQYADYFTDPLCRQLKAGTTLEKLNGIEDAFFRKMAKSLWYHDNGKEPGKEEEAGVIAYDPAFHLVEIKPYLEPRITAAANKTAPYGRYDNATGIHVKRNEEVVVFVDGLKTKATLCVLDPMKPSGSSYEMIAQTVTLQQGINHFKAEGKGLLYVVYNTADENWKGLGKSTIHIASGIYNGIWVKGESKPEEWGDMLKKASFSSIDIMGDYTHMIMPVMNLRASVPDVEELIGTFDRIVYEEQVFSGFKKYNRMTPTRMTVIGGSFSAHMFAMGYSDYSYTGYSLNGLKELMPVEVLKTTGIWGPAHELGHVNQLRPAFRWGAGSVGGNQIPGNMTEVSNNVYSLFIQTMFGNRSRIMAQGEYATAWRRFFVQKLPHTAQDDKTSGYDNVFNRLVPYWQLYLYFTAAGKYTGDRPEDFYGDLMEVMRNDAGYNGYNTPSDSQVRYCMDRFALHVSDVTKTNMTKFFNDYGFLLSDATVLAIAAKGYPAPAMEIRYIHDENVNLYKTPGEVVAGTANMTSPSQNNYTVNMASDSRNAVAYEVYTSTASSAQPILITPASSFSFLTNVPKNMIVIKVVGADGTRKNATISQ